MLAGPFDILGDVHGCAEELVELLGLLGYAAGDDRVYRHSAGRKVVFLGDLVDRGPHSLDVLRIAMGMVAAGTALSVPGNHEVKLLRALRGDEVQLAQGMAETLEQLAAEPLAFRTQVAAFLDSLESHYLLDDGKLVVTHAGIDEEQRGQALSVYGHTPVNEPEWQNGTINLDTGCVFGGRLTALRYPELELVSVTARRVYARWVEA